MSFKVPQEVFDLYNEAVDAMIDDNFGVPCQLISIDKVETIVSNPDTNNLPTVNSINSHRKRGGGGHDRGTVTVTEKEVTTDITLRCYWSKKDWVQLGDSNVVLPDADCMTIGYLADLPKVKRAKAAILNTHAADFQGMRFVLAGEPAPWGFKQNRYFVCYWKKVA